MTTVTQHYGISGPVPFINVNVYKDNELFVDPFAIRMGLGPANFAAAANFCTETFFDEVTRCVVSTNPGRHAQGLPLLQRFEEPRETRLGMSRLGFNGHGGGEGVGAQMWSVLTGNAAALVQVGVLKRIEEIPLFVPNIADDITSDLTTRVIFKPLVDFTNEMVSQFPALAGGTGVKSMRRQVWDPIAAKWDTVSVDLPTVDQQPLLLVPRRWVRPHLTLTATRFYETSLLSHVQAERAVVTDRGKILKTPKDRLRRDPNLARDYDTIVRIVEGAYRGTRANLVADFKRWAQERYIDATDEQIDKRIA